MIGVWYPRLKFIYSKVGEIQLFTAIRRNRFLFTIFLRPFIHTNKTIQCITFTKKINKQKEKLQFPYITTPNP